GRRRYGVEPTQGAAAAGRAGRSAAARPGNPYRRLPARISAEPEFLCAARRDPSHERAGSAGLPTFALARLSVPALAALAGIGGQGPRPLPRARPAPRPVPRL